MARTSMYGTILDASVPKVALPSWVTNAGYGDLTKELASADIAAEQADQQRLKTIADQNALDRAAEQRVYQDALADKYKETQPKTMREAYEMGAEEALSRGRSGEFLSMRDKLDTLDKQEKDAKRQSIKDAIDLGKTNPDYAQKMLDEAGLPGSEIFNQDAKKMLRTKGTGRNAVVYDPESDKYVPIIPKQGKTTEPKYDYVYNYYTGESQRIKQGTEGDYGNDWSTKKPTPDEVRERKDILGKLQQSDRDKADTERRKKEPSFISNLLGSIAGTKESRAPVTTPTPVADRPRGDSQRGAVTVGDEVATMTRKRSVK